MENRLHEMYTGLPFPETCPIRIPGYTEALSYVEGVRVIPDPGYYEDLPVWLRHYFIPVEYPAYYVPIKTGNKHYGFILKGQGKMSSRFSTYYPFFNLDALLSPHPYVVVTEGIKDAGIFLERGIPTMAMLTSGMSEESARVFLEYQKVPILVQDKDAAGDTGSRLLRKYLSKQGFSLMRVRPVSHKDMGDYYDRPDLRSYVESTFNKVQSIILNLESHHHSFSFTIGKEPVHG